MSRRHVAALPSRRWARVRRVVLDRDGWRCRACGRYGNEVDHVIPLERGGEPFATENLQALCRTCHIEKTAAENSRAPTAAESAWRALVQELTDAQ